MNIKIISITFILCFFITSTAYSKDDQTNVLLGAWLGEIEMGGNKFRLIFHINKDSSGGVSGSLDIPEKEVKNIPLNSVLMDNNSVIFKVFGDSAKFSGTLDRANKNITGAWIEASNNYPLTLNFTTESIVAPANMNLKLKNGETLDMQSESPHFKYFSTPDDIVVLSDIENVLEQNYNVITSTLKAEFADKIRVYIYPDIEQFHHGIFIENGADWIVAAASTNEIKMVSPQNSGRFHDYTSLIKAVVHELVHTSIINIGGANARTNLPKWLDEGYAFYEADQMSDDYRQIIRAHYQNKTLPKWSELANASAEEFGDMNGYIFSASIIEFLINTYGIDKLVELIHSPESFSQIYGQSTNDLEKVWAEMAQ